MCLQYIRIPHSSESVSYKFGKSSKRCVFAPCGHCDDCRKKMQYSWAWRLTSDLQYYVQTKGYRVGFITLTYNDESLPRFPACYEGVAGQPCFSKQHTERAILYIRKKMFEQYGATNILYFLASEYGKKTQRPHYHLLVAWPARSTQVVQVNGEDVTIEHDISAAQVHELIRHYWCDDFESSLTKKIIRKGFGFVCPATPLGGESKRSGKKILPFEVVDLNSCMMSAFYTAKYVTKDIYFMRTIKDKVTSEEYKELKQWLPHHRQMKSLGFDSVACLDDCAKINLLTKGRCFLGGNRLMLPPLYIQRKLLFSPCYIVDFNGNRLCRDQATDFYYRNFDLITSKKVSYYDTLFHAMKDSSYWTSSGLSAEDATCASLFVSDNDRRDLFGCSMAEAYLHYYGRPWRYCYVDKKLTEMMAHHYWYPEKAYMFQNFIYSGLNIDRQHWDNIQEFFRELFNYATWKPSTVVDEDADFVHDFYNEISAKGE